MNNFYKGAIETFEILIKTVNGNNGNKNYRQYNISAVRKRVNAFNRKTFLSTRRRVMFCNK